MVQQLKRMSSCDECIILSGGTSSITFLEIEFAYKLLKQFLICSMSKKTPCFNN